MVLQSTSWWRVVPWHLNLSEAMLIVNVLMVWSLWSTPPLAVASRATSTSSSNCRHTDSLLAAGHKIRRRSDGLLWDVACDAWRLWALWCVSRPGSSSISPGAVLSTGTVRFITSFLRQLIFDWCIFRPVAFLQTLPHLHFCSRLSICISRYQKISPFGALILPPSRVPLGVFLLRVFRNVFLGAPSQELQFGVLTLPAPVAVSPSCPLSLQLSSHFRGRHPAFSWKSMAMPCWLST